jgi:hypothetical protein
MAHGEVVVEWFEEGLGAVGKRFRGGGEDGKLSERSVHVDASWWRSFDDGKLDWWSLATADRSGRRAVPIWSSRRWRQGQTAA